MSSKMKLVLETGQEFPGEGFGAHVPVAGEIVFNTSVVGYQEILSDPSYSGIIVLMTYPPMGQYGITDEDYESRSAGAAGLVVSECCETPSNFRYTKTLSEDMEDHKIPGISGLDTRMLTHIIRDNGPLHAAIVPEETSLEDALAMIRNIHDDEDPFAKVSCTKRWFSRTLHHKWDVVVLDCGVKHSIVTALNGRGCNVTVVPYFSSVEEIMAFHPDGVLVSSGPGNPHLLSSTIDIINGLKGQVPLVGIGLGFELIALSYGATLEKLACGIHGGAPVRNIGSGKIITVNHHYTYSVNESSLKTTPLTVTYRNVTDSAVVGLENKADRVSAVLFYPEGGPGAQESDFFDNFIKAMED